MTRVLVTGGCGYVGSFTARWLREHGYDVVAADDFSEGHRGAWDGDTQRLDLLDREGTHAWLRAQRLDGAVHCAARAYVDESTREPVRYWRGNLVPLVHLAEALHGVPIVFSSSCAAYGLSSRLPLREDDPLAPASPYGATKAACERFLADRAAAGAGPYAALRYFNAAGAAADGRHGEDHRPETHLIPRAVRAALGQGEPLVVFGTDWDTPDGTCVRDFVHVEDLAAAHLLALEHLWRGGPSGTWNLGCGRGHSVRQVLAAVGEAAGRAVPWRAGPRRAGDPAQLWADSTRARAELSWAPRHDLGSCVASAVRWHRDHPLGYGPKSRP